MRDKSDYSSVLINKAVEYMNTQETIHSSKLREVINGNEWDRDKIKHNWNIITGYLRMLKIKDDIYVIKRSLNNVEFGRAKNEDGTFKIIS
jgi:hypothetical protein